MNKPPKLVIVCNILVGLFYGFIFFMVMTEGVDDDVELAKVAWGHIAVDRFQEVAVYAVRVIPISLVLTWLCCFILTRNFLKTTKWAIGLTSITLSIILISAAIGCIQFYINKPIGPF